MTKIFDVNLQNKIHTLLHVYHRQLQIKQQIKLVNIQHLGFGENNESLHVRVNNTYDFAFRIAMQRSKKRMLAKEKHMEAEFKTLQKLPAGSSPRVYVFDKSKKILPRAFCILSYVKGKHKIKWSNKEVIIYATALAKLHNKKYNFYKNDGETKKQFNFYKHYSQNWLKDNKSSLSDRRIEKLTPKVLRVLKENNHYFTELTKFTRIHGDLCNDNVLFSNKGVMFIDWEWSHIGDPARDVARIFSTDFSFRPWYVKFTQTQKQLLLSTYLQKCPDKTLQERIEVWNTILFFSDLLYFVWKIKNFQKQKSGFPKKKYIAAVNTVLKALNKKFKNV